MAKKPKCFPSFEISPTRQKDRVRQKCDLDLRLQNCNFVVIISIALLFSACASKHDSKGKNVTQQPISVERLAATETTWDGSKIKPLQIENPKINVLKITIKKGVKLGLHKHPVVNVGYMIQGQITVHTESGRSITIKEGESLVEVINQWHYGENTGDKDAIIVVTYIGDKHNPITIKKEV